MKSTNAAGVPPLDHADQESVPRGTAVLGTTSPALRWSRMEYPVSAASSFSGFRDIFDGSFYSDLFFEFLVWRKQIRFEVFTLIPSASTAASTKGLVLSVLYIRLRYIQLNKEDKFVNREKWDVQMSGCEIRNLNL